MENEVNDEIAEVVIPQEGETTQVAAEETPVEEQEPMLPKSRFDEVNARMKAAEQAALEAKQQVELLRLTQANTTAPQPPKGMRQQALDYLGLQNEEYLTVKQQIQVDEIVDYARNQQVQQQQFMNQAQDYSDVVGSYNQVGQFIPSENLREVIKSNPSMRGLDQLVSQNSAYAAYAYTVAKQQKQLRELQAKTGQTDAQLLAVQKQQELLDKTAPLPGAAAGGGSAANFQQKAASMGDAEFAALQVRIMRGDFD